MQGDVLPTTTFADSRLVVNMLRHDHTFVANGLRLPPARAVEGDVGDVALGVSHRVIHGADDVVVEPRECLVVVVDRTRVQRREIHVAVLVAGETTAGTAVGSVGVDVGEVAGVGDCENALTARDQAHDVLRCGLRCRACRRNDECPGCHVGNLGRVSVRRLLRRGRRADRLAHRGGEVGGRHTLILLSPVDGDHVDHVAHGVQHLGCGDNVVSLAKHARIHDLFHPHRHRGTRCGQLRPRVRVEGIVGKQRLCPLVKLALDNGIDLARECLALRACLAGVQRLLHTMCAGEEIAEGVGVGEIVGADVGVRLIRPHRAENLEKHLVGGGESLHLVVGDGGLGCDNRRHGRIGGDRVGSDGNDSGERGGGVHV